MEITHLKNKNYENKHIQNKRQMRRMRRQNRNLSQYGGSSQPMEHRPFHTRPDIDNYQ